MGRATALQAAIAAGIRVRREDLGRTQDDVARSGRELGFDWTAAIIAAMETGKREIHFAELVAVLSILEAPLAAILQDEAITLSDKAELSAHSLVTLGAQIPTVYRRDTQTAEAVISAAAADAERKVARRLGVAPGRVSVAAYQRWGRSLTEERDARVAELVSPRANMRTIQALRGHVTRALMDELRESVGQARSIDDLRTAVERRRKKSR
jgi:transcriptional regulator with XRE-family HTH domain